MTKFKFCTLFNQAGSLTLRTFPVSYTENGEGQTSDIKWFTQGGSLTLKTFPVSYTENFEGQTSNINPDFCRSFSQAGSLTLRTLFHIQKMLKVRLLT